MTHLNIMNEHKIIYYNLLDIIIPRDKDMTDNSQQLCFIVFRNTDNSMKKSFIKHNEYDFLSNLPM